MIDVRCWWLLSVGVWLLLVVVWLVVVGCCVLLCVDGCCLVVLVVCGWRNGRGLGGSSPPGIYVRKIGPRTNSGVAHIPTPFPIGWPFNAVRAGHAGIMVRACGCRLPSPGCGVVVFSACPFSYAPKQVHTLYHPAGAVIPNWCCQKF